MKQEELVDLAVRCGASKAGVVAVAEIPFRREFRAACEQNYCGRFGTCWMCPPDVGDIDEMIERAKDYREAFVFQTISDLEDSFDIEGMEEAAKRHAQVTEQLTQEVEALVREPLRMAAGNCQVCPRCARMDDEPCRFPQRATASLESYGIAVSELAPMVGMQYINGENTVTYFGAFLYR